MVFQIILFLLLLPVLAQAQNSPYPASSVIESISWDCSNRVEAAQGSDLWPLTWHDDGHLYTAWGDGFCGFAECSNKSSIGITRIKGTPTNLNTEEWLCDVSGTCTNSPSSTGSNPDSWSNNDGGGKILGMLSISGVMYGLLLDQGPENIHVIRSTDDGVTWSLSSYSYHRSDLFWPNAFLNFGQSYSGARDGFVYIYGTEGRFDTPYYLARVPVADISNLSSNSTWEYFSGTTTSPAWSSNVANRQPIFTEPDVPGENYTAVQVAYNAGIDRYLLTTAHGSSTSDMDIGVFDAPEPWGPWTTAHYETGSWCGFTGNLRLQYNIPTKTPDWMSVDGTTIHVVWSGASSSTVDKYIQIKGTLVLPSEGGVLYASPGGSGTACTQASPCSRSTGMNQVQSGQTLRLLDGNYIGTFSTVKSGSSGNPITIEAENKWGARFSLNTTCGSSTGNLTNINHSNLIIRGIDFDFCRFAGSNGGVRIGTSSAISNVTFEHNRVRDTQASGIHYAAGANNLIIRHNRIEDTGHRQHWGECNYVSNANAVEIYGNTFHGCTENGVDVKGSSFNLDIHHNIFEDQIAAVDQSPELGCGGCDGTRGERTHGTIRFENGLNSDVHDNIGRRNAVGTFGHVSTTDDHRNIHYHHNVLYDDQPESSILGQIQTGGSAARNEFDNNTACDLSSYSFTGGGAWNAHDNDLNVAQSLCDAEESRIINEMANLPGVSYEGEPSTANPEISKAYALRTVSSTIFVELADPNGGISIDPATGFSAKVAASPVTISAASCASTVSGTAVCTLTHDGTVDESSDTIAVSYDQGTGNVLDGSGEELAAFTNTGATNWYDKVWNTDVVIAASVPNATRPVSALFDDDFITEASSMVVEPGPTLFVEFDTINPVILSNSIVAGDAAGNFFCLTYDLETKMNVGDVYTLVVDDQDCNQRELSTRPFAAPTEGRFWRFTFTGPPAGVQVMEIDGELTPGEPPPFGPNLEACHTLTTDPGAITLDANDEWELTLSGGSNGQVYLLDSSQGVFTTDAILTWRSIKVYAEDCDPVVIDSANSIALGDDVVVAGITGNFADAAQGFFVEDDQVSGDDLITGTIIRNNHIYGALSGNVVTVESNVQNILIEGNIINGGGAGGDTVAVLGDGRNTTCNGNEPDTITIRNNQIKKDETAIPGWTSDNFDSTGVLLRTVAAGSVVVDQNWFLFTPTQGKHMVEIQYSCNGAATVLTRNYWQGVGHQASLSCALAHTAFGATGMVHNSVWLGNVFDTCNAESVKAAIQFGDNDTDVITGLFAFNLVRHALEE